MAQERVGGDSRSFWTGAEPRGGCFFFKAEAAGAILHNRKRCLGLLFGSLSEFVQSLGAGAGAATCLEGSSRWQPGLVML